MSTLGRFDALASYASTLWLCAAFVFGCGGSTAPAAPPQATSEATPAPSAPPPAPAATNAEASTPSATDPPKDTSAEAPPPESPAPGGKNITYRMTPGGLVIELDGVQLEPRAEPIKLGGGWGVKVVVRAKVTDDREHHLQNPTQGPLMIAEEIDRGGKKELLPDQRQGDGELTLSKSSTTPVERELRKPIVAGQSLTLYVGLWGLGADAGERKPIKKLFVVRMVAGTHKPQPVVSAPE